MMDLILYQNFPINDYENQVYYPSKSARDKAFNNFKHKTFSNLSSCDKTKQRIRLDIDYYHGNMYNYGCIIERDKEGEEVKRYYIFLNVVQWLSNNTVVLHYAYDYWQTYGYEVDFKQSFIEREHVPDDTFGKHLLDENLPVSEYIIKQNKNIDYKASDVLFCVVLSDNSYVWDSDLYSHNMGLFWEYGTGLQLLTVGFTDYEDAQKCIEYYVNNNKIDSIQGLYYAPVPNNNRVSAVVGKENDLICRCVVVTPNASYSQDSLTRLGVFKDKPSNSGYTPKNNKCFCYPYNFVNITNYLGSSIKAQYELSNDKSTIKLCYNFPTSEGASPTCYLYDYDGLTHFLDMNLTSFVNPELPFVTNQYSAYLSANTHSINNTKTWIEKDTTHKVINSSIDYAQGTLGSIMKIEGAEKQKDVTEGVMGFVNNTADYLQNANNAFYDEKKALASINASLADQASKGEIPHGSFLPSVLTNIGRCGFQMQNLQVTEECIKTIDNYFTMFGYKVNIIKNPKDSFTSRPRWNYIKTSGINVVADIPQDALNVIKQMFNSGVTLWHDLSYMYDYTKNNK